MPPFKASLLHPSPEQRRPPPCLPHLPPFNESLSHFFSLHLRPPPQRPHRPGFPPGSDSFSQPAMMHRSPPPHFPHKPPFSAPLVHRAVLQRRAGTRTLPFEVVEEEEGEGKELSDMPSSPTTVVVAAPACPDAPLDDCTCAGAATSMILFFNGGSSPGPRKVWTVVGPSFCDIALIRWHHSSFEPRATKTGIRRYGVLREVTWSVTIYSGVSFFFSLSFVPCQNKTWYFPARAG